MKKTPTIDRLREERARLSLQIDMMERASRREWAQSLVGRCYRYRNCYSLPKKPSDWWWLYRLYTAADNRGRLRALQVEVDCHGAIRFQIVKDCHAVRDGGGWQPITRGVFGRAYARALLRARAQFLTRLPQVPRRTLKKGVA